MFRRTVSATMLTLILTSILPLAFHIQPVETKSSPLTVPEESAMMQGTINLVSQEAPSEEWSRTYGGTYGDYANALVETVEGGYALAGSTFSYGSGMDDSWLVKTDAAGNMQWKKTYGGTSYDGAEALVQTVDGGYALAGFTNSSGAGGYDFWLVKTDASGNALWNKTYGGTNSDIAWALAQTADGGYALAGFTDPFGVGYRDFWLVKTDASGNQLWNKTYGGTNDDWAWSVVQTGDGGYALAGGTCSFGAGSRDFWLVKTDTNGNMQWNQTYGGTNDDGAYALVRTSDGGYALAGYTQSFGHPWQPDFYLVKTDASGNAQWNKTYGGTGFDQAHALAQTVEGGYALAGSTNSFGAGSYDFWLVKTDASGNALWNKTYGGTGDDGAQSLVQTRDGGYAMTGSTNSFGAGNYDFWLVKTAASSTVDSFRFPLDGLWTVRQRFGGYNYDWNGYHLGEDVLRSFEAPVFAPANGVVKHSAKRTGYGYVVIIEHQLMDGTFVCSVLGHLREAGRVPVGTKVTKGQIVGYLSSVPEENGGTIHLHFGIRKGMYSEELDSDGKWRYRGYGPIDIVGSWCPPSAFIEYYNENMEMPPDYSLTLNTEGGEAFAATSSTSVFTLVYRTILTLISPYPWFLHWIGTDNDIPNPTTVTMQSDRTVTEVHSSEPPPTPPSPSELAKDVLGKDYRTQSGNLTTKGYSGGKFIEYNDIVNLDCSGLVFWSYNKAHGSKEYNYQFIFDGALAQHDYNFLTVVNEEDLRPGDLLSFGDPAIPSSIYHVAMYVGQYEWNGVIRELEYFTTGGYPRENANQPILDELTKIKNYTEYNGNDWDVVQAAGTAGRSIGIIPSRKSVLMTDPSFKGFRRFSGPKVSAEFKSNSPIDLIVTDPDGFTITKDIGEIPGVLYYFEGDIDGDGEKEDIVTAAEQKAGNYLITVIPEQEALPTDTFTLEASANGTTILLADHAQISETPTDAYIITQNETAIMLSNINVALTNMTLSKNVVGQGYSLFLNVTVQNQGNLEETSNITLYADAIPVASQSVTLASGNSTTITFAWNTTSTPKGNYTISAYAWPLQSETYIADNDFTDGPIAVTVPGDVDGNFVVNMGDISAVLDAFGSKLGADGNYWHSPPRMPPLDPHSPNMDIDDNGVVNMGDITTALDHFGQHYP